MLEDFVSVIDTLRGRIRDHREGLSRNELRTRVALIDPMLQALGWDVADPSQVAIEFTTRSGRADYALMPASGKTPITVIEAKKLGEPPEQHVGQLLSYALEEGIRYGAVTDGNVWVVYDVFKQVALKDKTLLQVTVSDGHAGGIALDMLGLWRSSLSHGRYREPIRPVVDLFVETPRAKPLGVKETGSAEEKAPRGEWLALTEVEATGRKPAELRLHDGETLVVSTWKALYLAVFERLVRENLLAPGERVLSPPPGRAHIVDPERKHRNGKAFRRSIEIATGTWVDVNHSGNQIVSNSCHVLKHCGLAPQTVKVKLSR